MDEYDLRIREIQNDLEFDERFAIAYNAVQYISVSGAQKDKLKLKLVEDFKIKNE